LRRGVLDIGKAFLYISPPEVNHRRTIFRNFPTSGNIIQETGYTFYNLSHRLVPEEVGSDISKWSGCEGLVTFDTKPKSTLDLFHLVDSHVAKFIAVRTERTDTPPKGHTFFWIVLHHIVCETTSRIEELRYHLLIFKCLIFVCIECRCGLLYRFRDELHTVSVMVFFFIPKANSIWTACQDISPNCIRMWDNDLQITQV